MMQPHAGWPGKYSKQRVSSACQCAQATRRRYDAPRATTVVRICSATQRDAMHARASLRSATLRLMVSIVRAGKHERGVPGMLEADDGEDGGDAADDECRGDEVRRRVRVAGKEADDDRRGRIASRIGPRGSADPAFRYQTPLQQLPCYLVKSGQASASVAVRSNQDRTTGGACKSQASP